MEPMLMTRGTPVVGSHNLVQFEALDLSYDEVLALRRPTIGLFGALQAERAALGRALRLQPTYAAHFNRFGPILNRTISAPYYTQRSATSLGYANRIGRFHQNLGTADYLLYQTPLFEAPVSSQSTTRVRRNRPIRSPIPYRRSVRVDTSITTNRWKAHLQPLRMSRVRTYLRKRWRSLKRRGQRRRHRLVTPLRWLQRRSPLRLRAFVRSRRLRYQVMNQRHRMALNTIFSRRARIHRLYRYVRLYRDYCYKPPQWWFNRRKHHRWNYRRVWVTGFRAHRRPDRNYRRRVHLRRRNRRRRPRRRYDPKIYSGDYFRVNRFPGLVVSAYRKIFHSRRVATNWSRSSGWGTPRRDRPRVRRRALVKLRLFRRLRWRYPRFRRHRRWKFRPQQKYRPLRHRKINLKQGLKGGTLANRRAHLGAFMRRRKLKRALRLTQIRPEKHRPYYRRRRMHFIKISHRWRRKMKRAEKERHRPLYSDTKLYQPTAVEADTETAVRRLMNSFQRHGLAHRMESLLRGLRASFKGVFPVAAPFYEMFTTVGFYRQRRGGILESMPTVITAAQSLKLSRGWLRTSLKRQVAPHLVDRIKQTLTQPLTNLREQHNANAITNLAYLR